MDYSDVGTDNLVDVLKDRFGKESRIEDGVCRVLMDKKTGRAFEFPVVDASANLGMLERSMLIDGYRETKSGKLTKCALTGRVEGTKNKSTLFKQAMKEGFEELLEKEGPKVFMAVVQRAIGKRSKDEDTGELLFDEKGNPMYEGGSDVAAKMILDRIVPIADVEKTDLNKFQISINVTGMNPKVEVMDALDADFEEINQE